MISLRPYGLGLLASDLRQVGLHPTDMPRWELDDLTFEDAETLAQEALGSASTDVLRTAARPSHGRLPVDHRRGRSSHPQGGSTPLVSITKTRCAVKSCRHVRDVLVADPLGGDAAVRRSVLDAPAVLQPFRSDVEGFQKSIGDLVGVPYDRALAHLKGLEDAGVLLRRGASLRIVPDLLGDVVLAEACFDERSGTSTGYIERACQAADAGPLQNIFVNASRDRLAGATRPR